MHCSPSGSSAHGIPQARIVEWVAIPFSRGSSWSQVSLIAGRFFTILATMEDLKMKVAQSCLTLCDPVDYTVHGIFQVRILEWVAFPFSRGSSQPRDWTQVSCTAGGFLTSWATREAQEYWNWWPIPSPADLPNPGMEPWSPALQMDSFLAEPREKPFQRTKV